MKRINFSTLTIDRLDEFISLEFTKDDVLFKPLFDFNYKFSNEDISFLEQLIDKNLQFVDFYTEEELKMKFLSHLINRVNFNVHGFKDWYERTLKGQIGDIFLSGTVDFLVASGITEPKNPYFFIQEFKKTKTANLPLPQLLGEMAIALEINNKSPIFGAYIIGKRWDFVYLEKMENLSYKYSISESFDSLKLEDLKAIYRNLQAVKSLYCK